MATSRELLLSILALDSYNRGYNAGTIIGGDQVGAALITRQGFTTEQRESSFFATAYRIDTETNGFVSGTEIISYRGTDDPLGSFRHGDIFNGWTIAAGFTGASQAALAFEFYDSVTGQSPFDGQLSDLVLTGHSLGGGLAGIMAALSGNAATIFDPMPFVIPTALSYLSEAFAEALSFSLPPPLPSYSQIDATYVTGEALEYGRSLGPPALLAAFATTHPWLALALAGYTFGAEVAIDYTALNPHGHLAHPVDLHSQNLLVLLDYANEAPHNHTDWHSVAAPLLNALFNDDLGTAIGLASSGLNATGTAEEDGQLRTMVAYSALEEGVRPFGDKAIVALFNDADELGRLNSAASTNALLRDNRVESALAEIIVQYAGDLARRQAMDIAAARGVIDEIEGTMTVDLDPLNWVKTFGLSGQKEIVGVADLIAALRSSTAFLSPLGAFPIGTTALDTSGITRIVAQTGTGAASFDSMAAPAAHDESPGGVILIGAGATDVLTGGVGGDWLFGGGSVDVLRGGAGDDFLFGSAGNDELFGGDGVHDTAVFHGPRDHYTWEISGSTVVVTTKFAELAGLEGTDTLHDIEFLQFAMGPAVPLLASPADDLSAGTAPGSHTTDGGVNPIGGGVSGSEMTAPSPAGQTITDNDLSNQRYGTSGADTFFGNGGDDVLTGYAGQDSFDGGLGSDTVDYSYQPAAVSGTVDLAVGTADFTGSGFYVEQLTSIENVWMGYGNDSLVGDDNANDLRGGPGDDTLTGGLGNDRIYGDWKNSDKGGVDTAILGYAFGSGYTVSGSANALHIVGSEGDDWYYNVENFKFSGDLTKTGPQIIDSNAPLFGTQPIERASVATSGAQALKSSSNPSISADGRFVVFDSSSSNLVANDTNNTSDVFIRDLLTNSTARISTATNGSQANGFSINPTISSDGRFVVFESFATNLVNSSDTNFNSDVFLKDLSTGTTTRVSQTASGVQANLSAWSSGVSANGQYIVFESSASNLIAGDTNDQYDVFIKNMETGAITWVAQLKDETSDNSAFFQSRPCVSEDGRYVSFWSDAASLVAGDQPGTWDIFVKDLNTGILTRIPARSSGFEVNDGSSMSSDGRYIVFASAVSDLVNGDSNGLKDIFVFDNLTRSIIRVSTSISGVQANGTSEHPSISPDGRYVIFSSYASNLTEADTNGNIDLFVKDIVSGAIERVALNSSGSGSVHSAISHLGRYLAFESYATNLVEADTNAAWDIFAVDRTANRAPIAMQDSIITDEDGIKTGSLLIDNGYGGDSDADGDSLSLVAVNGATTNIGQYAELASGARVVVNADGRFVYDPNGAFESLNPGQSGTDSFTYTISDGQGHTSTATVTMTIAGAQDGVQISGGSGTMNGSSADDQIASGASNDTISGLAGFDLLQAGAGNDVVDGGADADWIEGSDGSDTLSGGAGNDYLFGGADADRLTGGLGADSIDGGDGADIYIVGAPGEHAAGEMINDTGGTGNDEIRFAATAAATLVVGPSVIGIESIVIGTGTAAIAVTSATTALHVDASALTADIAIAGNAGVNILTGGSGNDTLIGGAGKDTLAGGSGDDAYFIDSASEQILEGADAGDDTVYAAFSYTLGPNLEHLVLTGSTAANGTGNASANSLTGNAGNDVLTGGAGNDTLIGGLGLDTVNYAGTLDNVVVNLATGLATIGIAEVDVLSGIENAIGGAGHDLLVGNSSVNSLTGGLGNDTYVVDSALDKVIELINQGTDWVRATASVTLAANVENLVLLGSGNINGTGNTLNNLIAGNAGNNVLNGGSGIDTLTFESASAAVAVNLSLTLAQNTLGAGTDTITAFENLIGSDFADTLTGSTLANTLQGGSVNDSLAGLAGNDLLDGGEGADTMVGGLGDDTYVVDDAGDQVAEDLVTGGNDRVRSAISFTLGANIEALELTGGAPIDGTGNAGNNVIVGNGQGNILDGGSGNDTLDGKGGADTLIGSDGDDVYVVDDAGDVVQEDGTGADKVQSVVSFTLGSKVENLELLGSAAIDGTGNALANIITGNSAANFLDGGIDGDATITDQLIGGLGDDTYLVRDAKDLVVEGAAQGTDTVRSLISISALAVNVENLELLGSGNLNGSGNAGNNVIVGNNGDNIINGSTGIDTASYAAAGTGVTVSLAIIGPQTTAAGSDTLMAVENLTGSAQDDTLSGNAAANLIAGAAGADSLDGAAGNDTLDGGTGTDTLAGGLGNDVFRVEEAGDSVVEAVAGGTDLVQSTAASYTLADNVENLTLIGIASSAGIGNALANILIGNAGNNTLDGGIDASALFVDQLKGGKGDDLYVVREVNDKVSELVNEGSDTVHSFISYTLGLNVENLVLLGSGNINGTGNTLANMLTGNDAANVLSGLTGNDQLSGGIGADTLLGGLGNDTIAGGADADTFVFNTALNALANVDTILDFEVGVDKISLENGVFTGLMVTGPLAVGAFALASDVAAADDRIVYDAGTGALYYDKDGSGLTAKVQFATLANAPTLTAGDFLVT